MPVMLPNDPSFIVRLDDKDSGVWRVKTETSEYLLDLDARTAVRNPGAGAGAVVGMPEPGTASLRKDGEAWTIVRLIACEVGVPMVILARDIADDDVFTSRATTIVRAIEPA